MAAPNPRKLQGKVSIITGAASGIGEAAARLFAAHGSWVVLADVQDELGLAVAASIGGPDKCYYQHCDVRDEGQVEALVAHAVATYGRLDVMYSNAGIIGSPAGVAEMSLADFDKVIAVNVRGMAAAIKHAARAMVAGGSIVCTASLAGTVGGMGPHAYTVSKHAVVGLVRSAAAELGRRGIRVNCVSPAGVATPLGLKFSGLSETEVEKVCETMSVLKGVVLKAPHVAEAVLFLASEEAVFISGHNLVVDGGITAVGPPTPLSPID